MNEKPEPSTHRAVSAILTTPAGAHRMEGCVYEKFRVHTTFVCPDCCFEGVTRSEVVETVHAGSARCCVIEVFAKAPECFCSFKSCKEDRGFSRRITDNNVTVCPM